MARKDLSRTVIEGGRYYSNCHDRRASHGDHRASTREWLDRVAVDLDEADACDPPPLRRVYKHFRDKLAPAQRWLRAQVGRPWDDVYSDLRAQFDTRTVAGRHVVHDHMLDWVRHWDVAGYDSQSELIIDRHGILRQPKDFLVSSRKLRARTLAWAAGRVAAKTYRGWWWFTQQPIGPRCRSVCHRKHFRVGDIAFHAVRFVGAGPLARGELGRLDALPDWLRSQIVIASPL